MVKVLTQCDPFINQQRISCKIPWYSAKGNPTTANDIIVRTAIDNRGHKAPSTIYATASTKVTVTGCLHHHFHTSSQQLLNSTSSDTDVLWPPLPTTTELYVILCAA